MYTESAFHHQSYEILKDLEPYMRDLTGLLCDVSELCVLFWTKKDALHSSIKTRQRYSEEVDVDLQYQKTHEMVIMHDESYSMCLLNIAQSTADQYNPMQNAADIEKPTAITNKSGYLFERKNGRVYQSWSRKYYSISNGELTSVSRNPKVMRQG